MDADFSLRLAREEDCPALEALIPLSVRALLAPFYSPAQMEAALDPVYGVDRQIIRDGTYFVVEHAGQIIGCGGWSRRRTLFGGDQARPGRKPRSTQRANPPASGPSSCIPLGRGIGRAILCACESALRAAGFQDAVLVATLTGEPLYASFGYAVAERYEIALAGGLTIPAVRMAKSFHPPDRTG